MLLFMVWTVRFRHTIFHTKDTHNITQSSTLKTHTTLHNYPDSELTNLYSYCVHREITVKTNYILLLVVWRSVDHSDTQSSAIKPYCRTQHYINNMGFFFRCMILNHSALRHYKTIVIFFIFFMFKGNLKKQTKIP